MGRVIITDRGDRHVLTLNQFCCVPRVERYKISARNVAHFTTIPCVGEPTAANVMLGRVPEPFVLLYGANIEYQIDLTLQPQGVRLSRRNVPNQLVAGQVWNQSISNLAASVACGALHVVRLLCSARHRRRCAARAVAWVVQSHDRARQWALGKVLSAAPIPARVDRRPVGARWAQSSPL